MGLRHWTIAMVASATALASGATAADAATVNAQAKANVVKPLALSSIQDLDLGTLILAPGSWSNSIVSISTTGTLTCPANVTCSGATQVALYNVAGSNNQTVIINAPDITMVNQGDPTQTLTLDVDGPGTITLTNSGVPGTNFPLGGSITVNSTTATGTYSGTFEVTAEYQ